MLLTHNGWTGGNGLLNLGRYRKGALAAVDDSVNIDWSDPQNVGVAANSELLYLTNLWRQARGLPPVNPATAAPTVNVGLSPEVKQYVILGGVALLAVVLIASKKKR